jgi:hypothetical protein
MCKISLKYLINQSAVANAYKPGYRVWIGWGKHLLWVTFFAISCGQFNNHMQTNKSHMDSSVHSEKVVLVDTILLGFDSIITENFVTRSILSIEEVKQKNRYIDSLTNHKEGILVRVLKPTVDEKCYNLQVGYDNEIRFVNCFNFYIDPSTKEITIEDVLEGDRVTIEEWRKRQVIKNK